MSIFSSVPTAKISRSTFNLSHENKLSFNFGGLYPILCRTVLPGDKMSLGMQSFVRTVPLLSPVMHRNDIKVDSFFVPMRLIWKDYEKWLQCSDDTLKMPNFYLGNDLGGTGVSESTYNTLLGVGSLADYLGFASVPFGLFPDGSTGRKVVSSRKINLLPFRSYQLIYDYYYRNKSLEDPLNEVILNFKDSVSYNAIQDSYYSDPGGLLFLKYRSWRRDPFTSALPSPQKGSSVLIPESDLSATGSGNVSGINIEADGALYLGDSQGNGFVFGKSDGSLSRNDPPSTSLSEHYVSGLKATGTGTISGVDISKSNQPTIEDLRFAEVLEEYEEALARSGSGDSGSFKEWLLSIWRTLSPDARLDRPEYLGGYRGPIQISEVPQTSEGTNTSAQGTLAGKGLSVGGQRLFRNHVFKEPGYLMVIMSIVPKSGYFQGDPREFLYDNCFEFPNPFFAHLGEQEVLSQEVIASQALLNSNQPRVFGYNVRNYEMKSIPDGVHGALRSSLAYWHEARKFSETGTGSGNVVNLNENFVKMQPSEVSRIFPSIETSDKLIGEFFFDWKAKRSLPYYGVPRFGATR